MHRLLHVSDKSCDIKRTDKLYASMDTVKLKNQAKNMHTWVKLQSLETDWRNQDAKKCPDLCPETETRNFI